MTYGVVRVFQVIVNTLLCSPEKAGVGGSTPSLATIFSITCKPPSRSYYASIRYSDGPFDHFTRAFRDEFGVTPETIRAQGHLKKIALVGPTKMDETLTIWKKGDRFDANQLNQLNVQAA